MRSFFCALGICLIAGCSKQAESAVQAAPSVSPQPAPAARRLLVLATIAPMYCFTKNVAGDLADVEMIVPAGADPRKFEPSDAEVQRILQADVVVENGFGFEGWMDRLAGRLKPGVRVIADIGTGPPIPGLPQDPNTVPGDAPLDPSRPADPHVWLDPLMAIREVENIRDALMKRDPAHANEYLVNENRYEAALRDLDDEVGRTTVNITKRKLLCVGPSFSYFLSRYEFPVVGFIESPGDALAKTEGEDGVLIPMGLDTAVLNGKGLRVVIADPMESGSASTDYYEQTTRANARALREGLSR